MKYTNNMYDVLVSIDKMLYCVNVCGQDKQTKLLLRKPFSAREWLKTIHDVRLCLWIYSAKAILKKY